MAKLTFLDFEVCILIKSNGVLSFTLHNDLILILEAILDSLEVKLLELIWLDPITTKLTLWRPLQLVL